MPLDELLQRLVSVTPGQKSFLSVYLDLRPNRTGKKLHTVFLKARLRELSSLLPARASEQSLFNKDIKRIQKYLEAELDPAWKGIAIFACAADDLFLPIPMPLPPENDLTLSSTPYLFSLVRHAALYQTHAVVEANSRQARLFLIRLGHLTKQINLSWENKHTTRFGRMGWSLPRFQRHLQEHSKQRGKEIVENLRKLILPEKPEYLFIAAEEGMEVELKKQLSTPLKMRMVPLAVLDLHTPDHKLLSAASDALLAISKEKAETFSKYILEEAEPLGQATSGAEATLSVLQNHQIERMVFDARFKATGWRCPACDSLGMGGVPRSCPYCQATIFPSDLREEILAKAQSQGVDLFFTENFSPLLKAGGVAALLKYKTYKKTRNKK